MSEPTQTPNPQALTAVGVVLIADLLEDQELVRLYFSMYFGTDPRNIPGYEKAQSLFTLERDGHPVAHNDVINAMDAVIRTRTPRPKS